jgi:hypothetical protein
VPLPKRQNNEPARADRPTSRHVGSAPPGFRVFPFWCLSRSEMTISGDADDVRQRLVTTILTIANFAEAGIASGKMTVGDLAEIKLSVESLKHSSSELIKMIDALSDSTKEHAFYSLWGTLVAAFIIGSRSTVTDSALKYFDHEKTEKMRKARSEKPEEMALRAAIVAVRGKGPSEHPHKEAESICEDVNNRLIAAGHATVRVDTIYRRLKEPRS